jgi:hypothetical protein
MKITVQKAFEIIHKVAQENNIHDALDAFDSEYINHLVNRINEPDRTIPAKHTKASIFALWVCDHLGLNDCWDSNQLRQQKMEMR